MSAIARANAAAAEALVDELARAGVRDACVAPGSRSTPLVLALARSRAMRSWMVTDERCAAFFALGMARAAARPVAVVCTSGTAAANLAPAVAEAALAEVPLLLLTADRPAELRDCGAAQTIRQAGLFASHARWSVDAPAPDAGVDLEAYFRTLACRAAAAARGPTPGPVHLNLPFREPLFDAESAASGGAAGRGGRADGKPWTEVHAGVAPIAPAVGDRFAALLCAGARGLVVAGPRTSSSPDAASFVRLAETLGWPVLADPLSGVRYGAPGRAVIVDAYDVLLRSERFCAGCRPETVLRFGAVPTSKPLQRFLQAQEAARHVVVASPGTWPDPLFAATDVVHGDGSAFCESVVGALAARRGKLAPAREWLESWRRPAALVREAIDRQLVSSAEMFEGRVPIEVMRRVPDGARVFVGNSMPVRDFDTFTAAGDRRIDVLANRGANGIDGVLSTALGVAAAGERPAVLVVGDLSFLHDVGGLQIAARHRLPLVVIVVNNDGGGIFSFLPQAALADVFEPYFLTPHGLDIEPAVRMAGGTFARARTWEDFGCAFDAGLAAKRFAVIEVPVDRGRAVIRHREIVAAALESAGGALGAVR